MPKRPVRIIEIEAATGFAALFVGWWKSVGPVSDLASSEFRLTLATMQSNLTDRNPVRQTGTRSPSATCGFA